MTVYIFLIAETGLILKELRYPFRIFQNSKLQSQNVDPQGKKMVKSNPYTFH